MLYLSWCISGLSLFGATFKSKKWIQITSALIGISWFIFANFFNFSTMEFVSYINWPALIFHISLVVIVVLFGQFFKKSKIMSAVYGIGAILFWSLLVDTVDYFFLFSSWSSGVNYFIYVWNGIIFNLPKCIAPMVVSMVIAIPSISFDFYKSKKLSKI